MIPETWDAAAATRSNAAATCAAQVIKLTADDRVELEGDKTGVRMSTTEMRAMSPHHRGSCVDRERDEARDLDAVGDDSSSLHLIKRRDEKQNSKTRNRLGDNGQIGRTPDQVSEDGITI